MVLRHSSSSLFLAIVIQAKSITDKQRSRKTPLTGCTKSRWDHHPRRWVRRCRACWRCRAHQCWSRPWKMRKLVLHPSLTRCRSSLTKPPSYNIQPPLLPPHHLNQPVLDLPQPQQNQPHLPQSLLITSSGSYNLFSRFSSYYSQQLYRVFRKNCVFSQFTATPPSPTSM